MDFLDPAKKRQHNIRLFIGYILMAIVLGLTSWLIFLLARGYSYNRHTGQIIQNGLVFVDSKPVSADVYVNGDHKGKTSLRLNIPSGNYSFLLKSNGYRDWSRTFYLDGGSVTQLVYPLLFPAKLLRTDRQLFNDAPVMATQSPNRRWLLVQPAGSSNKFDEFDFKVTSPNLASLSLPSNLLTKSAGSHKLFAVEWSSDNRHVLLKHNFRGGSEFIMFDRAAPSSSINLNKLFGVNPSSVEMRDHRFDKLYLYSQKAETISTADLKNRQLAVLLSKVMSFKSDGPNQLIYVTNDGTVPGKLTVKLWDGQKSYLLNHYPAKTVYKIVAGRYSGADYIVIAPIITGDAYIYKNPLGSARSGRTPQPFKVLRMTNLKFLSFSPGSRFISAQSGNRFGVYDIDSDSRYYYQLGQKLASSVGAIWMDGQRLTLAVQNKTLVFDFDGVNQQYLTSTLPGQTIFFDPGFNALYNIAPSVAPGHKIALTRTELKIK